MMAKTISGVIDFEEDHQGGGRAVAEGILTVLEAIQEERDVELPSRDLNPHVMKGMMAAAHLGIIPK